MHYFCGKITSTLIAVSSYSKNPRVRISYRLSLMNVMKVKRNRRKTRGIREEVERDGVEEILIDNCRFAIAVRS